MIPRARTLQRGRRPAALHLAAIGLLTIGNVRTAAAQEMPAQADQIEIKVSDVSTQGQLIKVPVNKTVMVDFSKPVREVRLAKPDIAEVTATSPTQILVTGKSFGTTQLIVWFNEEQQTVFDVAVDIELQRLMASIRAAVPRAKIRAYALLDAVVLTGTVPDAISAQRAMEIANVYSNSVMNQMRVAGVQQVLLRVTIAEVNRSSTRQLGFNGWMAGKNFPTAYGVSNLDQINPANIGAAADASVLSSIPFLTDGDVGIPIGPRSTLSIGFPRIQMQVFIQALRENGLLRVLAEPNLVTVNGQEANFLVGGEFPIPVPNRDGITIAYRKFGVQLRFTPAVISENLIRLQVASEVSEPDFTTGITVLGTTVPGLASRTLETVVELGSGQTLAIGGLLSEKVRGVVRKVPGLGDLPVIGPLFSSVEFQKDESELVILVTPELVEPVSPDQVTYVPGRTYVAPNDFELFIEGKLDGQSAQDEPILRPRVNHNWPVKPSELYEATSALKLRGPLGPAGFEESP